FPCNTPRHIPLLSLILSHPPIPPLFPYTTLFRSRSPLSVVVIRNCRPFLEQPCIWILVGSGTGVVVRCVGCRRIVDIDELTTMRDRKSTRLNSSHQIISYAVFFLQKKMEASNWTR